MILKQLFARTVFRYVFIGGLSFVVELISIAVATEIFHANSLLAVGISFWIGLVVSFILQKVIAFRDKLATVKHIFRQTLAYGLLIIVNYIFTLWTVSLIDDFVGTYLARTIALVVTTGWNYIIYSKIIFKTNKED